MKVFETRFTEKQLSRWLASALLASSVLLCAGLVLAQSSPRLDSVPSVPASPAHPAATTAPPSVTPESEDPPAPRTPAEIAADRAIAERVQHALAHDELTRSQPIDIEVTRGIANLSGNVATQAIAMRALSIARATGGVSAVQDAMKVDTQPAVQRLR